MLTTRSSISGIMGMVGLSALIFAGLKAANPIWATGCFALAFFGLVASILTAIQSRGPIQAFWIGFAVAGWSWFGLAFILFPANSRNSEAPYLLTTTLLEGLERWCYPDGFDKSLNTLHEASGLAEKFIFLARNSKASNRPGQSTESQLPPNTMFLNSWTEFNFQKNHTSFLHIGQSLMTLFLAYLGGLFSWILAARRERNEAKASRGVSPSSP